MADAPPSLLDTQIRNATPQVQPAALLGVALAYAAMGVAAIQLAIGPISASPLFPSAGIALAAVLVYGRWAWWSVYFGSLGVQSFVVWSFGYSGPAALAVAAAIPLGAAAQAALGAHWVQKAIPGRLTLDGPKSIGRLFLLGGVLACLVNASWATLLLWLSGAVPTDRALATWATWWGGDMLGVIIAVPAVLTLIGRPRRAWRPRRATVGLPLVIATVMLTLAIVQIEKVEQERTQSRFDRDASELARTIKIRLQGSIDALDAIHSLFVGSDSVDARAFRRATASWLPKLPGLQAIGWHERVARDQISELIARARAEGDPYFRVFERDASLTESDTEALVMRFVEPRERNTEALGMNVMSSQGPREALAKARLSDTPVATRGYRMSLVVDERMGVVAYRSVYDGEGSGHSLRGMVFVALRMDDAVAGFTAGAPGYLRTCLYEIEGESATLLGGPAACRTPADETRLVRREDMGFAGRTWRIEVRAEGDVPSAARAGILGGDNSAAWLFSLTGLAATGLMGALLLLVTGRERLTQTAVEKATHQLQREIADRQLTERALRESEGRFRSMFKTVPVGMLYTELNGRIKQVNAAICHLTGYSEEELLSLSMATLTHHEDRDLDDERRRDLIAGRRPMHRLRMRYVAKNGDERWVRSTITVMRNAQGQPHRLVALVEDIREHLRLEEAEKARESAEAANQAKNEFLSRMSHELRTPLNAMLGFAQLLELDRTESLHERHRLWVAQIQQAGWHLLEMINDVLDLSRIESGTLSLRVEPLAAEPLIAASLALVEPQARARGINLVRVMADHGAARWIADATRVKQILTNLLSNAVKYNRDGGEVRIATRRAQDAQGHPFLELDVIDTGIGIDADQLAQLFQPFNRLGREKDGTEGTGIGLVIARLLAERQGGSLGVKSEPGVGSIFTLRLPLHDEEPTASAMHTLPGEDGAGYNQRHVLYVEDNETNVEVMRGIFGLRPQIRLSVATTGRDGLAAVHRDRPDLVLLDMHLPDFDGMELLHRLKANDGTADVPVIVVSADALPAQVEAAYGAGALRYMTKPVAIDEMLDMLDEELTKMTTRFG
jgi:PAS domain S-box-containing protein